MIGILDIAGYESSENCAVREEKTDGFSALDSVCHRFEKRERERERERETKSLFRNQLSNNALRLISISKGTT
jgi:hypothetical protein